jgi:hypothetical protein
MIVSVRLRDSSRSRRSSRSSIGGNFRPSYTRCKSPPSQYTVRSNHLGSSRPPPLPAYRGWRRSRRVHRCRDEACRWRSRSRSTCSYVRHYSVPEPRPQAAHRQRRPGGAACHAVFAVPPMNGSPRQTAVHPWPHLLSDVDSPYAPRVSARYRDFTANAIPARQHCIACSSPAWRPSPAELDGSSTRAQRVAVGGAGSTPHLDPAILGSGTSATAQTR